MQVMCSSCHVVIVVVVVLLLLILKSDLYFFLYVNLRIGNTLILFEIGYVLLILCN